MWNNGNNNYGNGGGRGPKKPKPPRQISQTKWNQIGIVIQGKNGLPDYIKLDDDIQIYANGQPLPMNPERRVRMQNPVQNVQNMINKGVIQPQDAQRRMASVMKSQHWLKFELFVPPTSGPKQPQFAPQQQQYTPQQQAQPQQFAPQQQMQVPPQPPGPPQHNPQLGPPAPPTTQFQPQPGQAQNDIQIAAPAPPAPQPQEFNGGFQESSDDEEVPF